MFGTRERSLTILVLALLIAFALRVYLLDARPVWYDEAFSVFLSEQGLSEIVQGTAADIQPPLYYLLLHAWQGIGEQVFVMRFLSVSLSLLTVSLLFAVAKRLLSRRAAVLAVFFAAIAPFQIAYAQELRMYSLLEFSLLAYFLAFVMLTRDEKRVWAVILLALSGATGLYSQSLAILTFITPNVYCFCRRDWRVFKQLCLGQAFAAILFSPWLVVLAGQFLSVQRAYWTGRPGLVETIQLLLSFTTNLPMPDWFLPIALFLTLSLTAAIGLAIIRDISRGSFREIAIILAFAAVPPVLMFILSYIARPIFVTRAVILSSVAFVMLAGWLVARIRIAVFRRSLVVMAALVALFAVAFQSQYDWFPRPPFAAADRYLRENAQSGDAVVHDNKLSYFPMHLYDRSLAQTWLPDPANAGSNTLAPETMRTLMINPAVHEEAVSGASRVWFVIFQRAIDEAQAAGRAQPNLVWFERHFRQVGIQRFNDLDIYLYER